MRRVLIGTGRASTLPRGHSRYLSQVTGKLLCWGSGRWNQRAKEGWIIGGFPCAGPHLVLLQQLDD